MYRETGFSGFPVLQKGEIGRMKQMYPNLCKPITIGNVTFRNHIFSAPICAVGQRANQEAADALRGSAPFVRPIGDCVRPANICMAVYEAYHAALDI